jgi:hypothetical protein
MARLPTLRSSVTALAVVLVVLATAPRASAASEGRTDPVVLAGSAIAPLNGIAPDRLVAFRFKRTKSHKHEKWTQIPVQVDQRMFVDFGSEPPNNAAPGSTGTVYGTAPIGYGAMQYADANTFVGPDPNPALDGDDEIALIAGDAGDRARKQTEKPKGTRGAGAVRVMVADPLGGSTRFVYLYESKGSLAGGAGEDYVDYAFNLASGDYKTTYKRADGPNPETSTITTDAYQAGFSDRWYYDRLAIKAGGASNVDILDGFKFSFGPTSCGRSEATFNDAEGAFVANIDGPVRAIRSYVGANSGPLTERTNYFYPDRHLIVTDLRVHPVPGPLTYHDLSAAGIGMTYLDSTNPGGVAVDGVPDTVSATLPAWHLWSGPQGSLWSADRVDSSFKDELMAAASLWYLDDSTPAPNLQCWGDAEAYGQAGIRSSYSMPNTDPRGNPVATLHEMTTDIPSEPGMTTAAADQLSRGLDAPLEASVKPLAD